MAPHTPESPWQVSWIKPSLPWTRQMIRPADIAERLCIVMLAWENILEDAIYAKVVPNQYVVELNPENYARYFQPIKDSLIQQWRDRLVEHLLIANNRLGRKEYRFGGQVRIELRPEPGLKDNQGRILSRVHRDLTVKDGAGQSEGGESKATIDIYLEWVGGNQRWYIYPGVNTIGRDKSCDIVLELPAVQEKRMVSSQHAYIRRIGNHCELIDGGPSGRPSTNGTFVNFHRISDQGIPLHDGDTIILAATKPDTPLINAPGSVAFKFRAVKRTPERS